MKILFTILLLAFSTLTYGQTETPQVFGSRYYEFKNTVRMDSGLIAPRADTTQIRPSLLAPAFLRWRPQDQRLYIRDSVKFRALAFSDEIPSSDSSSIIQHNEPPYSTIPLFDTNFILRKNVDRYDIQFESAINKLRPKGKRYYVSPSGNDSNDGLSPNTPLLTLSASVGKSDIVELVLLPGVYYRTNAFPGITKSLSIFGNNAIVTASDDLSFTFHSAGVYKTNRSNVLSVVDVLNTDLMGTPVKLQSVGSLATCQSTKNSWYTDGTVLYVHRIDEGAVNSNNTRALLNAASGISVSGNNTVYIEGVYFEGQLAGADNITSFASGGTPTVILNKVRSAHGTQNGFHGNGGHGIVINSIFAYNVKDGISYRSNNSFVEINPVSYSNGVNGGIDIDNHNGSTAHEGSKGVRVNGIYSASIGPNIEDTGAGTESWIIGGKSFSATSTRGWGIYASLGARIHVWGGTYYNNQAADLDKDADPGSVLSYTPIKTDFNPSLGISMKLYDYWVSQKDTISFNGFGKIGGRNSDFPAIFDVNGNGVNTTITSRVRNSSGILLGGNEMSGLSIVNEQNGAGVMAFLSRETGGVFKSSGYIGTDSVSAGAGFVISDIAVISKASGSDMPIVRSRWKPDGAFTIGEPVNDGSRLSVAGRGRFIGTGTSTTGSASVTLLNTTALTGREYHMNSHNNGFFHIFYGSANASRLVIDSTGYVAVGGIIPTSKLQVDGPISTAITTVTGNTTLGVSNSTVLVNNTGSVTITLPPASGISGRIYTIKKISAATNDVIIDGNAAETIDNAATKTLTLQWSEMTLQSNGTAWFIIASHAAATVL